MSSNFEFYNPVKIVSGENVIKNKLAKNLKKLWCKKIIVLSGSVLNRLGITDYVVENSQTEGIDFVCKFTNIPLESSKQVIQEICEQFTEYECDSIIAVGGGSVLDTAKVVKLALSQDKNNLDNLFGFDMAKLGKNIPLIAIPTTCGTGSEVTKVSVICDEDSGTKEEFISSFLLPDVAFLDPKMLETLPKKSVLLTAFDALAHAIEGYCCKGKNIISDKYSQVAIKLIMENLSNCIEDNCSPKCYTNMIKGACFAGISFSNSMVGALHALAHSVGAVLGN